ncbi:hypothetical protein RIF29_07071 [Crotalaria pallida]|uniref:UBC core domain-containing protein n=1 Tax=Crotalaria pallida TaxID=3830 RepID=A0AAN9PBM8_CROPI
MEKPNAFLRFDVVSDASDHYFLGKNNNGGNCFSNAKSGVYKSIMKQWKILQQNLPESIYVRVYENNIDLMRAVIVGAAGTPYHNGLFFFDIAFPFDYPNHPPNVHYRSFGHRLNPNLYADGKVCLSLLNTWSGKKCEKWDPSNSTILQVLLSIQGLVLNERPLYNEPTLVFGTSNMSRAYNCQVFELTCRSSVYLLRSRPKYFQAFVVEHFRQRGLAMLSACNEYVNGRVVGHYNHKDKKVPKQFMVDIKLVYGMLRHELRRCGVSLGTVAEHLILEEVKKKSKSSETVAKEKKDGGILKRVAWKIKKVLGWKNSASKKISMIEG